MNYISKIIGQPSVTRYDEIAESLIKRSCIKKTDSITKKTIIYRFAEIEFYLWNRDTHPTDESTYNRICHSGEWFFHSSGVDIAFETIFDDKNRDELVEFGGILIRGLEKYEDGILIDVIGGPRLCCWELFNNINSLPTIEELPKELKDLRTIGSRCRVRINDVETKGVKGKFCFFLNDVKWNMKTPCIKEKEINGKWHVVIESSSKNYTDCPPKEV